MNKKFSKLYAIASIFTGISLSSIPIMASADWVITGLGTLGGTESIPTSINNLGQVVGYSTIEPGNRLHHAFITGHNGVGMTDLGAVSAPYSIAYDINDFGQMVINEYDLGSWGLEKSFNFITGPNGIGRTDLAIAAEFSHARRINDSGQVVGHFGNPTYGDYHAFITGPNGIGVTDLGTLGGIYSGARDLNNLGQVVGYFSGSNYIDINNWNAFITGPNGIEMTALGTLDGSGSVAVAINNLGQAVGYSTIGPSNSAQHAFITGPNGVGMTALSNWDGPSQASDINDSGQVIGAYLTDDGNSHAFFYSQGSVTDLSLLPSIVEAGWTDLWAQAINNNGQIVGYGSLNGVGPQAFLLSYVDETTRTVSEPGTLLLVGLGLLGISICYRSRTTSLQREK